ncbi:MAG: Helicase associated domain protein [Oscillospiraceae bacterium]|nr:Helicase associated domain protein [Oscillospiraceae bacterium]
MITLYEHNQKAYDAAVTLMSETGRAAVIHPTGTGKSFIGFKLAEQHPDMNICWLSPSEYIYKTQFENLKLVTGGYAPDNICFMTYAKLMVTDEGGINEIQPDYIVLDEFHRCGAAEWGKGVERLLTAYPDIAVLGLSATNIRYLDNHRDMADELFDGNVASEITLGEAIVRNILLPPVYITSIYSYQKDLEKYQRRVRKAKNAAVRNSAQKYLDALRRTLNRADGLDVIFGKHIKDKSGKFIVFCANAEHMREMIDKVPEWFHMVDSKPHIYSIYTDNYESEKEFESFKKDSSDRLKLLFCIDMLNEGVHVEDISGVILLRPTVSPIIYKQQIGRALSASKGRVPVIFDIVNNFESLYSISSIEEEMQEVVSYYRNTGKDESIINANFHVVDEVQDCRRLFDELQDCLSASWEMMFAAAKRYHDDYGNLFVPKRYKTEEGLSLGSWIETQRRVKSGSIPGIMTGERVEKLNSIGMVWQKLSDFNFERSYQYAKTYYEEHGNLDIVVDYETADGFALGEWICNMRQHCKGNTHYILSEERIRQLDEIGMIWDKLDYIFEKNYSAAKKYYEIYGNLDLPSNYKTGDGINIGAWVRIIRKKYENSKLSKSQIKRLNEIGMTWINSFDSDWERNYAAAKKYYEKYGNLDIPVAYMSEDNLPVGAWIRRHRSMTEESTQIKLTKVRRAKLDAIGMIWQSRNAEESWEARYRLAKEYYEKYSNLNIRADYVSENGIWLGKWVNTQKQIRRGNVKGESLTAEQEAKLNAIGIDWLTVPERIWNEYYHAAEAYYRSNGNLNVKNGYVGKNGKRLDNWLRLQKRLRNKSKLSDDQIEKLELLGMIWDTPAQNENIRRIPDRVTQEAQFAWK